MVPLPVWLRRTLGILALGGGAIGVAMVLGVLMSNTNFVGALLLLVFLVMYAFGIYAGLLMLEDGADALPVNTVYWLLQVPAISTDTVGYVFFSGFHVTARVMLAPLSWKVDFLLGSFFKFNAMQPQESTYLGVNFFAIAVVAVLWRRWTRMHATSRAAPAMAG